jgi:uncharacterized repeat protein (TIGR01451 family)
VDNPTPGIGEQVVFTLALHNIGPTEATGVAVRDLLPAGFGFAAATPDQGTYDDNTGTWQVGTVPNGATLNLTLAATVTQVGVLLNTAEIIAADQPDPNSTPGNNVAGENDQASVTLTVGAAPALTIQKSGPTQATTGQIVTYSFTVAHDTTIGDGSPVSNITVSDDVAGAATLVGGDTNSNNLLEVGEVWSYQAGYTIQTGDPNPLVNIGTVEGSSLEGATISAVSTPHSTSLSGFAPALYLDKDGPPKTEIGQTMRYTFTVVNDILGGDGSSIGNITVNDDVVGAASYVSGDLNGNNLLDAQESWLFTADYVTPLTAPSPLVNVGTVTGLDQDGEMVTTQDTHSTGIGVSVAQPVLTITKGGPATARMGTPISYTFTVSHTTLSSGDPLTIAQVVDNVAGVATFVGGDSDGSGRLEAGEVWHYQANYQVPISTTEYTLVNTVVVLGTDEQGRNVSSSDSHATFIEFVPPIPNDPGNIYLPLIWK